MWGGPKIPWGDIVNHNPIGEETEVTEKEKWKKKSNFAKTEILFDGIQVARQNEGGNLEMYCMYRPRLQC